MWHSAYFLETFLYISICWKFINASFSNVCRPFRWKCFFMVSIMTNGIKLLMPNIMWNAFSLLAIFSNLLVHSWGSGSVQAVQFQKKKKKNQLFGNSKGYLVTTFFHNAILIKRLVYRALAQAKRTFVTNINLQKLDCFLITLCPTYAHYTIWHLWMKGLSNIVSEDNKLS